MKRSINICEYCGKWCENSVIKAIHEDNCEKKPCEYCRQVNRKPLYISKDGIFKIMLIKTEENYKFEDCIAIVQGCRINTDFHVEECPECNRKLTDN